MAREKVDDGHLGIVLSRREGALSLDSALIEPPKHQLDAVVDKKEREEPCIDVQRVEVCREGGTDWHGSYDPRSWASTRRQLMSRAASSLLRSSQRASR